MNRYQLGSSICLVVVLSLLTAAPALGQLPPSLKTVAIPVPKDLNVYVQDTKALVVLGKAFFWDQQAGSDGHVACANCHFHAGADHRVQNQLASPPGISTSITPNQTLQPDTFPFRKLADPADIHSAVVSEVRQTAGSAGQFHRQFLGIVPGNAAELGTEITGEASNTPGGLSTRQVTGRNAPSIINAILNVRNFWDGRASNTFTGATPFGDSDTRSNVLVFQDGQLQLVKVRLDNASLASVAVGPPINSTEMSYEGRTLPLFGKKMLSLPPMARQAVAPDDSVLGPMANPDGKGLAPAFSYAALIQAAFRPQYWSAPGLVDSAGNAAGPTDPQFSQMEFNFGLFWGLAIQAYETTLISDNSRFDQFAEGNRQALTSGEQMGLIRSQGSCKGCHEGTEFTTASYVNIVRILTTVPTGQGFFRTGVSPIAEDVGFGGTDTFGIPFFAYSLSQAAGMFKSAGFRNIELTGPYFHNGSQATLEQVLDFYNRRGDIENPTSTSEFGPTGLPPFPKLSDTEKANLVAFLKALTDDRVLYERAPFDHPELCIPAGHAEQGPGQLQVDTSDPQFTQSALDKWALIPAVGSGGNSVPLQTFQELLLGIGADGSRAHTLTQACVP